MQILQLSYKDEELGWSLPAIDFDSLTLLVGASGVGKTRILRSLAELQRLAKGKKNPQTSWQLHFHAEQNNYLWAGTWGNSDISNESISINGQLIAQRDDNKITFAGNPTILLPQDQSLVFLLREEPLIRPMSKALNRIIFKDYKLNEAALLDEWRHSDWSQIHDLPSLQQSSLQLFNKLYLAQQYAPDTFQQIKNRFCDIFPSIQDIQIAAVPIPELQLKEEGLPRWVRQKDISSGMLRSLLQISDLYLCEEGSVFLLDEFEYGLGANCIDEITDEVLRSSRKLQFILSSHHPYIINNIPFPHWRLISRHCGQIRSQNAAELELGRSRHSAFMQLMQLEAYQNGCNSPH